MSLTPEDLLNHEFSITKFRDGYEVDQVDDFLDQIAAELRQHEEEKAELRKQIEELTAKLAEAEAAKSEPQVEASEQTIVVDAPAPAAAPVSAPSFGEGDAVKSSAMLQLALELHDKHVSEGEAKRDQLIRDAEATSAQLVQEAQKQRAEELRLLGEERIDFRNKIKELREFEGEYRNTLRSYIQSQLRGLEGSPEPGGAPEGLQ